jgi:hypothetical protein
MQPNTIIVVEAEDDARPVAVRVPRPEPEFRGCGPERGAWEALRRAVESGSVRDEVAAIRGLHEAIFGAHTKRAA